MSTIRRGQIQLRSRFRWRIKRWETILRAGYGPVSNLPIVFGNAIPKSGSKLLFNILRSLEGVGPFIDTDLNEIKPFFQGEPTDPRWIKAQLEALRPGDIRFGYLYAQDDYLRRLTGPGWASFLILRDPRDQIISEIFYAMDIHLDHGMHAYLQSLPDMSARIDAMIHGVDKGASSRVGVREHYERFSGWWRSPDICVVRFEDLVDRRESELVHILAHLEDCGYKPKEPRETILAVFKNAMRPERSETFRKGKTGTWREHFTPQNIEAFKTQANGLLIELGYERDARW